MSRDSLTVFAGVGVVQQGLGLGTASGVLQCGDGSSLIMRIKLVFAVYRYDLCDR